mmetsp:Transcript_53806/g.159379  ORF Transcript_53806/g.159379 Transcript_53806/m.159379 type:complete len:250 (-) Transcript_53806:1123-1872(-)
MAVVWRCAVGDAGAADGQPCDECAVAVRRGRLLQHCRLRNAAAVDGVPRDVDPRRLDLQRLHAGASGGDADGADGCAPAAGRRWRRRAAGGARQRGDAAERHGDQRLLLGQLGRAGDTHTERRPVCGGAAARVDARAGGQPAASTAVIAAIGAVAAVVATATSTTADAKPSSAAVAATACATSATGTPTRSGARTPRSGGVGDHNARVAQPCPARRVPRYADGHCHIRRRRAWRPRGAILRRCGGRRGE